MQKRIDLFIGAHKPVLDGTSNDIESVAHWVRFIRTIGRSNIVKNLFLTKQPNLLVGLKDPVTEIFVQWLAEIFQLQVTDFEDLKSQLTLAYTQFLTTPNPAMVINAIDNLFLPVTEVVLGMQLTSAERIIAELEDLGGDSLTNKLNHWREDVFGLAPLSQAEVDNIINKIKAINWAEFCNNLTKSLHNPDFCEVLELQHEFRTYLKSMSRELLIEQLKMIQSQPKLDIEFLSMELLKGFLQRILDSLSGASADFIDNFKTEFFMELELGIQELTKNVNVKPGMRMEDMIRAMATHDIQSLLPKIKLAQTISPQPGVEAELGRLVKRYSIETSGLAAELAQEALLWFDHIPHFIRLWFYGYIDYSKLTEQIGISRRNFLNLDRPSVTRDCVGRVAVETYFQFLFDNFVPLMENQDLVLKPLVREVALEN